MNHRETQDGYIVFDHDTVYEILYHYLNAEYSESYPRAANVDQIPPHAKIWKIKYNCEFECKKINNAHNPQKTVANPIPENTF